MADVSLVVSAVSGLLQEDPLMETDVTFGLGWSGSENWKPATALLHRSVLELVRWDPASSRTAVLLFSCKVESLQETSLQITLAGNDTPLFLCFASASLARAWSLALKRCRYEQPSMEVPQMMMEHERVLRENTRLQSLIQAVETASAEAVAQRTQQVAFLQRRIGHLEHGW